MKLFNLKKAKPLLLSLSLLTAMSCSNEDELITDTNNDSLNTVSAKSSKSVELSISGATASTSHNSYPASRGIDGNTSDGNRWSGLGKGVTYTIDLGTRDLVDFLRINWRTSGRKYKFKVFTSNSSNSGFRQVGSKTSDGNNRYQEFDVTNTTARYVRLECNGSQVNEWNNIREVQVWGTGGTATGGNDNDNDNDDGGGATIGGGTGTGSANAIIGGNWKLNAYTGTLRVGNDDNGLDYADSASKSDNNNWFYDNNGYAYFKCYAGNPTSGGSSNPRSELRELTSNGSNINWDGTTNTEHSMKWKVRIDDLPPSGKVCFGQIHAESGSRFDDVIRVQVQGDNGQNSGGVTLRVNGYVSEELLGGGVSISNFDMRMDTEYHFEITMRNQIVTFYLLNNNGSRTRTLFTSGRVNSDGNYFKAGCYLQSTKSSHSDSNVFGLVGIKSLVTRH